MTLLSNYRFVRPGQGIGRFVDFAKAKTFNEVVALADKLEPKLRTAVLEALEAQKDAVDLDVIAEALEKGTVDAVLQALNISDETLKPVTDLINQGTWDSGLAMGTTLPRFTGVTFAFDQLNPELITFMQQYDFNLIREVNSRTLDGVKSYLQSGITEGKNPIAVARQVKQIVGLTETQSLAVARYRKELEEFHTKRSAKAWGLGNKIDRVNGRQVFIADEDGTPMDGIDHRRLRDFRFDNALARAMETGKPLEPEKIDQMVERYAEKYRKFRAQTIARTEAMRANAFGIQEAWRQAIKAGKVDENLVRRRWIVAPDERACRICRPIPGLNPKKGVKFAMPFQTPKGPMMLPPAHPNCRCTIFIQFYEADML